MPEIAPTTGHITEDLPVKWHLEWSGAHMCQRYSWFTDRRHPRVILYIYDYSNMKFFLCEFVYVWNEVCSESLSGVYYPFPLSSILDSNKSKCPSLPKLQHGYYKTASPETPHTVEFHCKNSLVLSGNPRRRCLADGTWSGKQPRCVKGILISTFLCPFRKIRCISVI